MARSRRAAKRVRYTEDSDDDFDHDPSRGKRSARPSQRPQTYREPSTDATDLDEASELQSDSSLLPSPSLALPQEERSRVSRGRSRRHTYREPSTDGSDLNGAPSQATSRPATRSLAVHSGARTKKPKKRRAPRTRMTARPLQNHLAKKLKPNTAHLVFPDKPIQFPLGPSGRRPFWQTLPFEALVTVMKHAAYPLYGSASRMNGSVEWLCRVSLLCRSFHEACIAGLLYSPPLYPSWHGEQLIRLLRRDQSKTITNYRTKIKRLDIEVRSILINKTDIQLPELIWFSPNLEHLRLYHNHDDLSNFVWAQPSAATHRRWTYPEELFYQLDKMNIKLKSFEWNGRFPTPNDVLAQMAEVHTRPSFSSIEELTLLNLDFPDKYPAAELDEARQHLTTALASLPNLKSLIFRTSNILDEVTTPRLPYSLINLEITNNLTFLSSHLTSYLASRGSTLHSLTLKHNQSMSLDFLSNLRIFTPRLRHLTLDLSYRDPSSYQDVSPLFDDALPDGPPTWPKTLITIEVENLRQISAAEADAFLSSLVDSADELTWLRRLVVKAIIRDSNHRERGALRVKWDKLLEEVFLDRREPEVRRSVLPERETSRAEPKMRFDGNDKDLAETSKRSTAESAKSKDKENRKARRSGRPQTYREPSTDNSDIESEQSTPSADQSPDSSSLSPPQEDEAVVTPAAKQAHRPRHGRCDIVQLVLSNQRPAQEQYTAGDFLDEEPSDDEDYREG